MMKHLSAADKAKVKELQDKLRPFSGAALSQADQEARDKLVADLDAIIAAECPLCGSVMIQSINQPFISKEEEAEASLWSIFRVCNKQPISSFSPGRSQRRWSTRS